MVLANAVLITPAAIITQGHYTTRNCSLTGASTRSTGVIFGVRSLLTIRVRCMNSRPMHPSSQLVENGRLSDRFMVGYMLMRSW